MLKVNVTTGDVTDQKVDAIATLVNSGGMQFGGVDGAIKRKCSNYYHHRLAIKIDYTENGDEIFDGKVYIVEGEKNKHPFKDVIFIIDDFSLPLSTLVFKALEAAQKAEYKEIAMPSMRTGVMAGAVEKTTLDTVLAMKRGILSFKKKYPDSAITVTIVIYNDSHLEKLFKDNF